MTKRIIESLPKVMVKRPFGRTTLSDAIVFACVQQLFVILLAALVLDGGVLLLICLFAVAGFWGGVGVLVLRRKARASRFDLALIRWGFLPVCALSFVMCSWIWGPKG